MTKRLMAKTGQYQKDGETKNRYTEIGVILSNNNGEYVLLDPSVNLAGVLLQQQALARETNGRAGDRVMVSVFESNQGARPNGGNSQLSNKGYGAGGQQRDLGDEIPFAPEWRA